MLQSVHQWRDVLNGHGIASHCIACHSTAVSPCFSQLLQWRTLLKCMGSRRLHFGTQQAGLCVWCGPGLHMVELSKASVYMSIVLHPAHLFCPLGEAEAIFYWDGN